MPLRPGLLADIQAAIGPALLPSLTATSAGADLYEAYVFCLVLQAARTEGATISFENVDGTTPTTFTFRTSPGHIWWSAHPYTHAVLTFPGRAPLEVHLGIYVLGASKVTHEGDVVVLDKAAAETSRQNQVVPKSSRAVLVAECKFYASNLKLGLARGFFGLSADMMKPQSFLVTNSESASVQQYLTNRKKEWEHRVLPGAPVEVGRLVVNFQNVFKKYKHK